MWRGDHHQYGGEMGGMDDHESWMTEVLGYESTSCIIDHEDGHGYCHGHGGLSRESDRKVSRDLDPQATTQIIPRNFPPPLSSSSLPRSSTLRSFKSNGRLVLTLVQHMPSPNVVIDDPSKSLPLIKKDKSFLHTFLHFTLIPPSLSLESPINPLSRVATRPSFPKVAPLNSMLHEAAHCPFAIAEQLSDSLCNIQQRIEDRFPLIETQFSLFRDTRASIRT